MEFCYLQLGGVFSGGGGGVASSKVEFRYLQLGGVFSGGGCSEQQGGVPLSPTGWCFQWWGV